MQKKHYAVIGHPIGHTMSPFIHTKLFQLASIDADYSVLDIPLENLSAEFNTTLKALDGFNITIPHKSNIIPYLNKIAPNAKMYGSVNTVKNDTVSAGYTTDPTGFALALQNADIPLKNHVVILGCGGVARTFAYEAVMAGCDLTIAVRHQDLTAAASLVGELKVNILHAQINTCFIDRIPTNRKIDLLVNATPIGMYPNTENCPIDDNILSLAENVFDAVYNPLETTLVKKARAMNKKALGGMSMLVYQAAAAQTIWNNSTFKKEDIDNLCIEASEELTKKFNG